MKPRVSSLIVALCVLSGNLGVLESSAEGGDGLFSAGTDLFGASLFDASADPTDVGLGIDVGISVLDTPDDNSVLLESQVTAEVVTYYVIQVEYASPGRVPYEPTWYSRGTYGDRRRSPRPTPTYTYQWVTIAESTSLEDAEWIYAWYAAAWEEDALAELAPDMGPYAFPTRVQLITESRPVTEVLVEGE